MTLTLRHIGMFAAAALIATAVGFKPAPAIAMGTDNPPPTDDSSKKKKKGNSAIAAHRDGLFRPLKNVKVGDEIRFRTTREQIRYRVTKTKIVDPDDVSVLAPQPRSTLTLITCYPFYYVGTAPKRFVVHAEREQPLTSP